MPTAFGKALKNIAVELSLEADSGATPDAQKKKRGRQTKDTPAKKLRADTTDKNSANCIESSASNSKPSGTCDKIGSPRDEAQDQSLGHSISRADLDTRDVADTQVESLPEDHQKVEAKTAAKGKAKPGRRKKSDIELAETCEGTVTSEGSKAKKAKPEGPYTKFKEESCIPEPRVDRREAPTGRKSFKVVAWNVGGLRAFARNRPEALPELVRHEQPDLLGIIEHKMQEAAADTEETMKAILEALPDYEMAALNCSTVKKGYSGTLILMRKDAPKAISVNSIDLSIAKDEGRLIAAEFEALTVLLAYVPNSGDGLKRIDERIEKWDAELRDKLQELSSKKPVVLLGDLNVAHRDVDIWNVEAKHIATSAGTTPQERDSFSKLLDAGFVDGFAHHHPEALGAFTYWSVRAGNRPKNRGLRLDYAIVSKSMVLPSEHASSEGQDETADEVRKPTLVDVFHLPEMSKGDHCPVGALLAV